MGGILAAPFAVEAQQAGKAVRIGILAGNRAASPHTLESFLQGLHDLGYVEGRNVRIEFRDAEGKSERLPALVGELLALKVDIVFAPSTPAALATKQATMTVPIVFAGAADPVADGLVTSLARPGGNVTGLSNLSAEIVAKRLEQLKQAGSLVVCGRRSALQRAAAVDASSTPCARCRPCSTGFPTEHFANAAA